MRWGKLIRKESDTFFDQLLDMRQNFDAMWNQMLPFASPGESKPHWMPAVEAYVDKGKYVVKAQLPGLDPKDIQIQVQGDQLTIRGEQKRSTENKQPDYLVKEFAYGAFERGFTLPEGVKAEALEAKFANGVLELSAPMAEKALPRAVEIKLGVPGEKAAGEKGEIKTEPKKVAA